MYPHQTRQEPFRVSASATTCVPTLISSGWWDMVRTFYHALAACARDDFRMAPERMGRVLAGGLFLSLLILLLILILILLMLDSIAVSVLLLAATLALARPLPAQNVAFILVSLVACEIVLEAVLPGFSSQWRGWLFWPSVIVWSRVGGRWFLRLRRKDWNYGLWLILLAGAVAALVQFSLARRIGNLSIALKLSAIRFAASAFCLFCLSPWFISKLPQQPQDHAH